MNRNIILIGMPGSGKTTIGEKLALNMSRNFVDLDKYIEMKESKTIVELFENGEEEFRKIESKHVEEMKKFSNCVIATGGGTMIDLQNVSILAKNAYIVYVKRDLESIAKSENVNNRPLLKQDVAALYKIFYERSERYDEIANQVLINDKEFDSEVMDMLVQEIIDGYNEKKIKIRVINGPNLNFLGIREIGIYGKNNYTELEKNIISYGIKHKVDVDIKQSNIEGEIIDIIQDCYRNYDGIVINAGAYTHYSIAILDALRSLNIPAIDVHLSNITKREEYRKKSMVGEGCIGQISGFGFRSYEYAIEELIYRIKNDY